MNNIDKELLKCEMAQFFDENSGFQKYCLDDMRMYGRTLSQTLESPITAEYYKSKIKGGCNYREVQT